ncbi:MAG: ImmA/IrrE family metallo-endopeptidase [Candidatus Cloacimonetes bacterium]|nr:ImmA/IrrE family metallo-endopeptidase [Candidatus Cloacimonadota bacterium]MBL7086173.1 ImmA/IrrE family metallo-endopeptidase [Candidatus Cloacimonadota bacterium]
MKKKSFEVEVNPQIIKWVINTSGWSINDLSQKSIASENTIKKWIKGEKYPTFRQLENLSKYLKRPVAVFLLPNPPEEKPLPKDHRTLPENRKNKFDKKTILAIRIARRLQGIVKELGENLNQDFEPKISFLKLSDNPKEIAESYRNKFQITEEVQKNWKSSYFAFNTLRKLIEDMNILVFQLPMPIEDARGFVLTDDIPPVIVINSKDEIIEARIFTLLHEFAHILLGESGIDMPENSLLTYTTDKIEKWCNDFASLFLLPTPIAMKMFKQYRGSLTQWDTLHKLSVNYKVSKGMLLYNMKKFNYITKVEYEQILNELRGTPTVKRKGGLPPYKKCISQKGWRTISLVTTNLEKGFITTCDVLDYLSIKHKQFDKLLSEIER